MFTLRGGPEARFGMLAAIRQFFDRLTDDSSPLDMGEEQVRLAVAALLYHVIAVDGVVTAAESATLLGRRQSGNDPFAGQRAFVLGKRPEHLKQ